MSINVSDIKAGSLYRTSGNQERVVLEYKPGGKVKYTSRGGNVQNEFDVMQECEPTRFASKCSEKIKDMSEIEFNEIRRVFVERGLILD